MFNWAHTRQVGRLQIKTKKAAKRLGRKAVWQQEEMSGTRQGKGRPSRQAGKGTKVKARHKYMQGKAGKGTRHVCVWHVRHVITRSKIQGKARG